ncbi:MAG: hypothetical protein M3N14_04230 [Bacteroidota bacterium]|nr:hypothetical protein [Bacteroidota bacterium]
MKKIFLFFFVCLTVSPATDAQSIIHTKEWKKLAASLKNQDWKVATELSLTMLNKAISNNPDADDAARLRYLCIYSEAGLMTYSELPKSQELKKVIGFTGQRVILPPRPISLTRNYNSIRLVHGKTDSLSATVVNKNSTAIFSFEYFLFDTPWPADDFKKRAGKLCTVEGTIRSISVEGTDIFPSFRIILDHCVAKLEK